MSQNNPAVRPNVTVVNMPPPPKPPIVGRRAIRTALDKGRTAEAQMFVIGVLTNHALRNVAQSDDFRVGNARTEFGNAQMAQIINAATSVSGRIIGNVDAKELR